ncbi:MAG TPA: hypothetical protein VN752_02595, partial [Solirubrobacterales bacterium]|nr:hypothetical protein [Solirubrobacterales bacterium]
PSGEYVTHFGPGQLSTADGIELAQGGNVIYVTDEDAENSRVTKWSTLVPDPITNPASGITQTVATLNASINPSGYATTYQFEYGKTTAYGTSVPIPAKEIGSGGAPVSVSQSISGLTTGTTYHFRVAATNKEGTVAGGDLTFTTGIAPPTYQSAFGSSGSGNGQFKVMTNIAVDPADQSLWVTDDENDRLQHFSSAGAYLGQFKTCYDPAAVAVKSASAIYVACASGQQIQKYNSSGQSLKQLASWGSGNGQVVFPLDLTFDAQGDLWVADTENDRVQEFDSEDKFSKAISLGAWSRPWSVDVTQTGKIWVAEPNHSRVSAFDQAGKVLLRFGTYGTGAGQFNRPTDVEVDANGFLWVTDAVNDRVQVFNETGGYITQFGQSGAGAGQIETDWWLRVALGANGVVWLTDQGNSRVQRWQIGS